MKNCLTSKAIKGEVQKVLLRKNYCFLCLLCILSSVVLVRSQTTPAGFKAALQKQGDDTGKVNLLNKLSFFYVQTNLDSVLYFAKSAKGLSEKLNYRKGEADALMNFTRYHQNKGDYTLAMQHCLNALRICEEQKEFKDIGTAYLLLATVSKDLSGQNRTNEYVDKGIDYIKKAYKVFEDLKDTSGLASALITSGIIYRDKSIKTNNPVFFDTAFFNYTAALQLIESSSKGRELLPRLYNNISQVYLEHLKDYDKALEYLYKAVAINKASNNNSSLSYNYGNISNAYIALHEYDKALEYANNMLNVSRQLNRPYRIQNAMYQLFQVYTASNMPDSALRYYLLSDRINDSLTDLAKTSQVMELQTKYETGRKELQIQQLNTESLLKNRQITMLVVALVLFVIFAAAMIMLYKRVQNQKQQIGQQSKRLEMLMKELHHRVKNNLQIVSSLLSLQTYKLNDEATIAVLKESQQRVQAMSLIHQRLYKTDDFTCVNIKEYVTDLAETLLSAYGYNHNDFNLQIQIEKETMDVDQALPIGLMINEMVTNSMKYAYENISFPSLKIALTEDSSSLILTIKDNGKGIDEKAWKQKSSSFGKQLITALSKQLRATQTLLVDNGTQFTVTIPKQQAA